jgi:pectinesterase
MNRSILLALALLGPASAGPAAEAMRTATAAAAEVTLTVAADGSGGFATVQAAVDAVSDENPGRVVIQIKPGRYKERVIVPRSKPFITFQGEGAKTTVLTYDWNARHVGPEGRPVGTSGSYSTKISGRDFVAEGITFENTAGDTGQALALYADADRLVFRRCRFLGWQDTLYANGGRHYYNHCELEGRVDFIFGNATAVFDHCTIHSKNGGYVTAASTPADRRDGYVFLDCTLTGEGTPAYLGRPWRPYAAVTFLRCQLGPHVRPQGWDNWRNPENEKTARYGEYRCTGTGADRSGRVAWAKELTDEEAAHYTVREILGGSDGWDPTR